MLRSRVVGTDAIRSLEPPASAEIFGNLPAIFRDVSQPDDI